MLTKIVRFIFEKSLNVGIKSVIYANKYPDEEAFKILKEAGVKTKYFEISKIREMM